LTQAQRVPSGVQHATPGQGRPKTASPQRPVSSSSHAPSAQAPAPRPPRGTRRCLLCDQNHGFPECGQGYCFLCGLAKHTAINCSTSGTRCRPDSGGYPTFQGQGVCGLFQFDKCPRSSFVCTRLHYCSLCLGVSHGSAVCSMRQRVQHVPIGTLRQEVTYR
jgi:hypothetical protein